LHNDHEDCRTTSLLCLNKNDDRLGNKANDSSLALICLKYLEDAQLT